MKVPADLGPAGKALWAAYEGVSLPVPQRVILHEACRAKDRLDKLDLLLSGDVDVWARLVHRVNTEDYELRIDDALAKANATAASLRASLGQLPEVAGSVKAVSALDELEKRRRERGAAPARQSRSEGAQ